MANVTTMMEFLLLGFSEVREQQLVHTVLFLLLYLERSGNLLIVAVTTLNWRLHTPKYFFLRHLSILDLCYISTTVPISIVNSLTDRREISFLGCVFQVFVFISLASTKMALLTVMSFNRYVAICLPLRYEFVISRGACGKMAASSWFSGSLSGLMQTAVTFSLPFRGSNEIHQFFCDIPQLLKLSGSDWIMAEMDISALIACLAFICFVPMIISYVCIFSAVLRLRSSEGQNKAFSICLPHLVVVAFFFSTGSFAYLKPPSDSPSFQDLLVSVFYTGVPPTLNPLIYSLRNKDMKAALKKDHRKGEVHLEWNVILLSIAVFPFIRWRLTDLQMEMREECCNIIEIKLQWAYIYTYIHTFMQKQKWRGLVVRAQVWESENLGSNPGSATYLLCDLRHAP
uniref:G-protein coupled receptors family 1 profile domain-containing protein n=1 Tax=Ornithorhynchus anatinus TaxID=9258 RepID=A0A6I8N7R5_ORNAN